MYQWFVVRLVRSVCVHVFTLLDVCVYVYLCCRVCADDVPCVCTCVCVCCVCLLKQNACPQQQTHLSYAAPLLHLCRLSHTHAYPLLISLRLRDFISNTQTISTSGLVAWKVWVCRRSSTRLLLTAMTGRTCQKSFTAFMH